MSLTTPNILPGLIRWDLLFCSFIVLGCCIAGPRATYGQESGDSPTPPCSLEESHQFDFWVGTWDLTWKDGGVGINEVTSEYNGCVIRENFIDSTSPFRGMSVSVYNPKQKVWQQTWADNGGSYLDFVGGFEEEGTMRLSREAVVKGKTMQQRMTFYNIEPDSLDWDWELSADGGETWRLSWRIHYTRRK